jgi:hypothetical protein
MPLTDQLPLNATTIVITSIMALVATAVLYSQGAFTRTPPARKTVNNKAGNGGKLGAQNSK